MHGINAAGMKRMAFQQAPRRQTDSIEDAIPSERLMGVGRARRMEPAMGSGKRGDPALIKTDDAQAAFRHGTSFLWGNLSSRIFCQLNAKIPF